MNLVLICMHYKACRTKRKRLFSKACISACIQEKQNFRAQFCARKFCCNKSVYGNGYLKSGVASTSMSSNSIFSPPMAQMKV